MVEHQPSKLMVRVRFPSPAPLIPVFMRAVLCHNEKLAHVAQSVEHLLGKEEVEGSIPFVSTTPGKLPKPFNEHSRRSSHVQG